MMMKDETYQISGEQVQFVEEQEMHESVAITKDGGVEQSASQSCVMTAIATSSPTSMTSPSVLKKRKKKKPSHVTLSKEDELVLAMVTGRAITTAAPKAKKIVRIHENEVVSVTTKHLPPVQHLPGGGAAKAAEENTSNPSTNDNPYCEALGKRLRTLKKKMVSKTSGIILRDL